MGRSSRTGRPSAPRNPLAGAQLRCALKLLGKTWRKNVRDPDHVLRWEPWATQGLPRSPTTIDADLRLGIPEDRLGAYARCLGLAPGLLGAPDTDIQAALAKARELQAAATPVALGFGPPFPEEFLAYNAPHYLQELFALMGGVYRVAYALPFFEVINHCVFWVQAVERHLLQARGLFVLFGLDNPFQARLYRWHNNLHATYLCDNRKELGHFLLMDPLRHNLIARRDPFWLKGQGVTDSGLGDNVPVPFAFRMTKLPALPGEDLAALWERECAALRQRPTIQAHEADYPVLLAEISEPDRSLMQLPGSADPRPARKGDTLPADAVPDARR